MKIDTRIVSALVAGALLQAAAAAGQGEPFSWSTSFEDLTQAGLVTADWNTRAGTLSLPPLVMAQVGSYAFGGGADRDVAVDGRVVFALDGRELFCLDGGRPAQLPLLGRLYLGTGARAVAADDGQVVVAMGAAGLRVLDARNPAVPALSGSLLLPAAVDVALTGRVAYVVDGVGSLHQVSLANPAAPALVESFPLGGTPNRIARDGNVTVVGLGAAGFTVMTAMTTAMPWPTATVATAAPVLAVSVLGNRAFVTTAAAQLLVYDIGDPASPQLVATLPTIDACTAVRADADFVYAAGATRLERWHLPFGGQPQPAGAIATGSAVRDLVVSGRHAFLAGNSVMAVELVVPASFTRTSSLTFAGTSITDLHRSGDLLAVATTGGGKLVDVADPAAPFVVADFGAGNLRTVDLTGDRLVYQSDSEGLVVMDVTDRSSPAAMGSVPGITGGRLAVDDWRALTSHGGLQLWDLQDPYGTIPQLGTLTIPIGLTTVVALDLQGDRACVGTLGYVHVYDVSNPAVPAVLASFPTDDAVRTVAIVGDRVVATCDGMGLLVYDTAGAAPALLGNYPIAGSMFDMEVVGDRAVVEDYYYRALRVLDIGNPAAGIQLVQSLETGSGSGSIKLAFGTTQAWISVNATQLEGRQFATHAWQPASNYAEIVPQEHAGIVGMRASAVYTGDPDAITWTFVGDGAWWDLQPAGDGAPAPWQYDDDGAPGDWSWNVALALGADGRSPVISDLGFEFLFERPVITAVTDVPNDQGRQLRLQWRRSGYDRAASPQPLLGYAVYRLVDPLLGTKALNPPSAEEAKSLPPGDWDYLGLYAADGEDTYSVIVPSLADASVEAGDYATTYLVRARTTTVGQNHDSLVLAGVSVDNLAPNVPQQVAVAYGGSGNALSWLESADADLRYFNVYRGTGPDFTPGPGNLIHRTTGTGWTDAAAGYGAHYKVTAVDFAGNESDAAAPTAVSGVPGAQTAVFGLAQNVPNPFNPRTVIGFSLDRPGPVRLRVYDVAGRLVRTLHDGGLLAAGSHQVVWDGSHDTGQPAAAGVYYYRLEAGGRTASLRLTLLK
ncbi:MAG: hypothetical protein IH621_12145 [Krumholzibacteria bacterium]|nr:hypothetical protein [Candidatus Krumholzibacteria bacterium]